MFKTIDKHPTFEIDENGNVRNTNTGTIRRAYPVNGHPKIILSGGRTEYVSRLVAETFIPNPYEKTDVRHIDGDKNNNKVSNLEWTDHSMTQKDSYGLGANAPGGNEPAKKVMVVETGDIYPSIKSCAKAIGGSASRIRRCIENESSTHKGFHFRVLSE